MNNSIRGKSVTDPISKIQNLLVNELRLVDQVIKSRVQNRVEVIPLIADYVFSAGGKRIRTILLLLCTKLFGYRGESHITLSAAVEFIHTATLLHDDVVDNSEVRRGRASVNQKWDNKNSILVGDYLFSQAFCLMAQDGNLAVMDILSKTSAILSEGELIQTSAQFNLQTTKEKYIEIISAKTAELFSAVTHVAAIISKRPVEELIAMKKFGKNLGLVFQIIDDTLDYSSSDLILGKNIGEDFKEGKVTLPIILVYDKCNDEEKEFWNRVICLNNQNQSDFHHAMTILNKYNIFEEVKKTAREYYLSAKDNLQLIPDSESKQLIIEILDFSLNRAF